MSKQKIKVLAVIPARYASTRLPGKPLVLIKDKPMIQWVYERVKEVSVIDEVIVATDDLRIFELVKNFGGKVMMTSKKHQSGTDRVAEVVKKLNSKNLKYDFILNVQGDEPLVSKETLNKLVLTYKKNSDVDVVTPICRIKSYDEYISTTTAKIVFDKNGYALYFSRSPIPIIRDVVDSKLNIKNFKKINFEKEEFYRHIGIYGYKNEFLLKYVKMAQSKLELLEKLEQLRILENGYKIKVVEVKDNSFPVDTWEDLQKIKKLVELEF